MPKKLKIFHIVSELSPYSKTGGLGDVARSLPKALSRLGQDISIITPLYGKVIDKKEHGLELLFKDVSLRLDSKESIKVSYWRAYLADSLPVYFVECPRYFSRYNRLYGSSHENLRFLIFDLAALKLISLLKQPVDIIHCHDWQSGLVPYFLKKDFRNSKTLKNTKTLYTIHNLVFQLGHNWWEIPLAEKDYGRKPLPPALDERLERINFAKRGILSADYLNTVSEHYRQEIMTKNFGQDLYRILKNRSERLFGIVNGIDCNAYNPENDERIKNYSWRDFSPKKENKRRLQNLFGLTEDNRLPLFCMTSRIAYQKGFELLIKLLPYLLKLNLQLLIIGAGDKAFIKELKLIARKHPRQLAVVPSHEANQRYETLAYAGSDFLLLPSSYEPCGINQLIAMRYGCIPIVRETGGLRDTVEDFSPDTLSGTGFTFKHENVFDLHQAVVRALENYRHPKAWSVLVKRAMKRSSGWDIPAKKYLELYKRSLKV